MVRWLEFLDQAERLRHNDVPVEIAYHDGHRMRYRDEFLVAYDVSRRAIVLVVTS